MKGRRSSDALGPMPIMQEMAKKEGVDTVNTFGLGLRR
jgi:hypothetical protein